MTSSCNAQRIRFFTGDRPVSVEDVLTVGRAFSSCDPALLVQVVLEEELAWSCSVRALGDRARAVLRRKAEDALGLFSAMSVVEDPYPDRLIVPLERFERDARGRVLQRLLATAVDLDLSDDARRSLEEAGDLRSSVGAALEALEACRGISDASVPGWRWWLPQTVGLASLAVDSWPASLARRIWLPSSLSDWERACVVGNIFWLMTYRGSPSCDLADGSARALATRVRVSEDGCSLVDEIRVSSDDPDYFASAVEVDRDGGGIPINCDASALGACRGFSTISSPDPPRMFAGDGLLALLNLNCRIDMMRIASTLGRMPLKQRRLA